MNKILIKHVVSLGSCCHTATFLKNEKLKIESYPFDWIFSGPKVNYEIITDSFKTFLDKSQYTVLTEHRSGHKIYGHRFFNHKDPKTESDYSYYLRCVERFNKVIKSNNQKLFIITNVIDRGVRIPIEHEEKEYTNKLYEYFKSTSTNFSLIYINPILMPLDEYTKLSEYFKVEKNENMYWITLYVKSHSDGLKFMDQVDNIHYKEAIYTFFDFDIEK